MIDSIFNPDDKIAKNLCSITTTGLLLGSGYRSTCNSLNSSKCNQVNTYLFKVVVKLSIYSNRSQSSTSNMTQDVIPRC